MFVDLKRKSVVCLVINFLYFLDFVNCYDFQACYLNWKMADFETQHILHLLINRLQSGEHPISSENGSIDFPLLSALTGNTEGWVGLVCQELLEAFQYSENDVRSSVHLEKQPPF